MYRLFQSKAALITLRLVGFIFLGSYLVVTGDWRISPVWALAYPVIAFSVAWGIAGLKLANRLPLLNRHLLFPPQAQDKEAPLSYDEWSLRQADYLRSTFRGRAILATPAEDGLVCVPVLLVGISTISAALGGIAFGLMHLGRFTYLECLGKTIIYTLMCYFVLPYGVLNVVLGHMLTNALSFVGLHLAQRKLSEKLRSNPTVDTDAHRSGARGSP